MGVWDSERFEGCECGWDSFFNQGKISFEHVRGFEPPLLSPPFFWKHESAKPRETYLPSPNRPFALSVNQFELISFCLGPKARDLPRSSRAEPPDFPEPRVRHVRAAQQEAAGTSPASGHHSQVG